MTNNDKEVTHPLSGSSSIYAWSNWNLELLVFDERGKTGVPGKTSRRTGENQQQPQTIYSATLGFESGLHRK